MAQVHQVRNRRGELGDLLGMSLGQGLAGMANDYYATKAIKSVTEDKSLENAPFEKRMGRLQEALRPFGERGQKAFENLIGIEQEGQKRRESEAKIKKEKEKGISDQKYSKDLEDYLVKQGMNPKDAKVAANSGLGVQTALVNDFLSKRARQQDVEEKIHPGGENEKYPTQTLPPEMNAPERVQYRNKLRTENLPIYNETSDRSRGLKVNTGLINRVEALNESHKLPEGIERAIINPETGEPYGVAQVLGLVNEDTQTFLKTINEFSRNAKETYGARVTNFDLVQYMKRFPGLLNTYEGRKNILSQMRLADKLTDLYDSELKNIYQHYGLDGIAPEQAKALAEKNIAKEEEKILEQFGKLDDENEGIARNEAHAKVGRTKVEPGTKITTDIVDKYLDIAKNDPAEAERMAREDGYEF